MSLKVLYEERKTANQIRKDAEKVECNRCGRCCVLPSGKDCKNLRRQANGNSYCAIYNRAGRIGSPIGEGQVCNNIMHVPTLYEGCPYNEIKIKYGIAKPEESK